MHNHAVYTNGPPGGGFETFRDLGLENDTIATRLQGAGYRTDALEEKPLTEKLQRLLAPGYRPPEDREVLRALLRDGLADKLPLSAYRQWLRTLMAHRSASRQGSLAGCWLSAMARV